MYFGDGIMDSSQYWEIEDTFFKDFNLLNDSPLFSDVVSSGYEEFYHENRLILQKIDIPEYIHDTINKHTDYINNEAMWLGLTDEQIKLSKLMNIQMFSQDHLIVIGFVYLKYQLSIPNLLKSQILNAIKAKINTYEQYKIDTANDERYDPEYHAETIGQFIYFKSCIVKEDGEGLTNIGSVLPKRTLYEQ